MADWKKENKEICKDAAARYFIEREDNREIYWDSVYEIVDELNAMQHKSEEPIRIVSGKLIDGQHRMLALCLSFMDSWVFTVESC